MSVWREISNSLDIPLNLLQHVYPADVDHPVFDRILPQEYEGNITVGDQLPIGRILDNIRSSTKVARDLDPMAFTRRKRNSTEFLDFMHDGDLSVGLAATYALYLAVANREIKWNKELDWKWVRSYVANMMRCNQYASYQSPKDASEHIIEWLAMSSHGGDVERFEQAAATFEHMEYAFNTQSQKHADIIAERRGEAPRPLSRHVIDLGKEWETRRFGSLYLVTNKTRRKNYHYLLSKSHIHKLVQMCESTVGLEMYFITYQGILGGGSVYQGYRDVMRLIRESMSRNHRIHEIARACDVAGALLLSYYARDIWNKSVEDQEAKIGKENLNEIIDVKALCRKFMELPFAEAVELSKICKFLPTPDSNPLTLFEYQRLKHFNVNPIFQVTPAGLNASVEDFTLYQRHQLLITFFARHGQCPGTISPNADPKNWHRAYPHVDPGSIHYTEANDIEYRGAFDYQEVTGTYNPYIKDKALSPNFLYGLNTSYDQRNLDPADTSYLLHYLCTYPLATPRNVAEGMSEERHGLHHTTQQKGEAKKAENKATRKGPRNYYINNYPGRILLSEIDNNIASYIEHKPGCFVGLSTSEAFNKFQDIKGTEAEHLEFKYVYISFDLAAWSPQQNPELRRLQLRKWAEAFDKDYIIKADAQFSESTVHYYYRGLHQQYALQGNDLEGYVARMNTDLHADIMGYTIRKLREARLLERGSKLAVQIDDGLCVLRFDRDTDSAHVQQVVRLVEEMYRWFSLEISWDKTYVSEHMRVFLNELDYDGLRITPGSKAYLRIRREGYEGIKCFLRETNRAAGMIMGAVEAGTVPAIAWMKYALEIAKSILAWTRRRSNKMTAEEATIWSFIPVAYGGIGSLPMICYMSNTSDDAVASGLSALKAICTYDPTPVATVEKFLNQPIKPKSPLSVFRDPKKFSVMAPIFTDLLEIPYAKRALRPKVKNPMVLEAFVLQESLEYEYQQNGLPYPDAVRGKAIQLAYEGSLISMLDSILLKFARSSTVTQLVGFRASAHIYARYAGQFSEVYRHSLSLIRG